MNALTLPISLMLALATEIVADGTVRSSNRSTASWLRSVRFVSALRERVTGRFLGDDRNQFRRFMTLSFG
jgi:hypothetical protein